MNIRQLAIICHTACRPVRKALAVHDELTDRWGNCATEYQNSLIALVNMMIIDGVSTYDASDLPEPIDAIVANITGAIVTELRDQVDL